MSAFLLDADRHAPWAATGQSATSWTKELAKRWGRSAQVLWRCKLAGVTYNECRAEFAARGKRLPPLSNLSEKVSAESIELLSKMRRIVPRDVLDPVEEKILRGDILKKDVQAMWATYAPLLEGATARGRGARAQIKPIDADARAKSDLLLGLRRSAGQWISPRLALYAVHVPVPGEEDADVRCDAVIAARVAGSREVQLHGVIFEDATQPVGKAVLDWLEEAVDFGWIARCPATTGPPSEVSRGTAGILAIQSDGRVEILRPARSLQTSRSASENLARVMIARLRAS